MKYFLIGGILCLAGAMLCQFVPTGHSLGTKLTTRELSTARGGSPMTETDGVTTCARANSGGYYWDPLTQGCPDGQECITCIGDSEVGKNIVQGTGQDPRVMDIDQIFCEGAKFLGICVWDPELEIYNCKQLILVGICSGSIYQADFQTTN